MKKDISEYRNVHLSLFAGNKDMLIWITGISRAGKTTIAGHLYRMVKKKQDNWIYLDGDNFREVMGNDLQHTLEDRDKNAVRMTRLCRLLSEQNINIICGANLTSQRFRDWCRSEIKDYYEIFLDVPMEILIKRDKKGLYKRALAGEIDNVVGVDIPFIPPASPDLVIDNSLEKDTFDDILQLIIEKTQMVGKF